MTLIKTQISQSIRGFIPKYKTVNDLMRAIDEQFGSSNKVLANTLIRNPYSMKLKDNESIRGYIVKI